MRNIADVKETVTGRLAPALEALEENVRAIRRTAREGRHTAEDLAAGAALRVRRRPLAAVADAGAVAVTAGCLVGFVLGWFARTTREPRN
jgi:hypothetical protein